MAARPLAGMLCGFALLLADPAGALSLVSADPGPVELGVFCPGCPRLVGQRGPIDADAFAVFFFTDTPSGQPAAISIRSEATSLRDVSGAFPLPFGDWPVGDGGSSLCGDAEVCLTSAQGGPLIPARTLTDPVYLAFQGLAVGHTVRFQACDEHGCAGPESVFTVVPEPRAGALLGCMGLAAAWTRYRLRYLGSRLAARASFISA